MFEVLFLCSYHHPRRAMIRSGVLARMVPQVTFQCMVKSHSRLAAAHDTSRSTVRTSSFQFISVTQQAHRGPAIHDPRACKHPDAPRLPRISQLFHSPYLQCFHRPERSTSRLLVRCCRSPYPPPNIRIPRSLYLRFEPQHRRAGPPRGYNRYIREGG